MKKILPFLAVAIGIMACGVLWLASRIIPVGVAYYHEMFAASPRCASMKPAPGFEAKLIGTWESGLPPDTDTLIIQGDHTYKQLIHRDRSQYYYYPAVDYQSDWQSWWVEYKADGIPYLHLSGMRLCGVEPYLSCSQPGRGGYDFCSQKYVPMKNEGILMILERNMTTESGSPRVIQLVFPLGDESRLYWQQGP